MVSSSKPDGRVDPKGKTLGALKKYLKKGLTEDSFLAIMAAGKKSTTKKYLPYFKKSMPKYQINSSLRTAHFLAQVGHETLSFHYTQEIRLNKYADRDNLKAITLRVNGGYNGLR